MLEEKERQKQEKAEAKEKRKQKRERRVLEKKRQKLKLAIEKEKAKQEKETQARKKEELLKELTLRKKAKQITYSRSGDKSKTTGSGKIIIFTDEEERLFSRRMENWYDLPDPRYLLWLQKLVHLLIQYKCPVIPKEHPCTQVSHSFIWQNSLYTSTQNKVDTIPAKKFIH